MGGCISAREVAKMVRDAKVRVVVASPSLGLTMMGYLIEAAERGVDVKVITRPTIVRGKVLPTIIDPKALKLSKRDSLIYFALLIIIMVASYLMHLPSSLVLFMGLALAIGFMMYMFREFIAYTLKLKPRGFTLDTLDFVHRNTARAAALAILLVTAIGGFIIWAGFLFGIPLVTWLIVGFGIFYLSIFYYYFLTVATLPRVQIDIKTREGLNKTIIVIDDEAWVGDEKCMSKINPEEAMKLIE